MGYVCPAEAPAHYAASCLRSTLWSIRYASRNLRYRNLRCRSQCCGPEWLTFRRQSRSSEQVEEERQLLVRIPGQVVVLRVANNQLGILIAQVGDVDELDGPRHGRFGVGVVDVSGDDVVDRDGRAQPDDGVVEVGPVLEVIDLGGQHRTPRG